MHAKQVLGAIQRFWICLFGTAVAHLSLASDVLPRPEAPFKGHIESSVSNSTLHWPQVVEAPQGAPNIVLILLDDLGFGATSTFGGPVQTPELDKLAARGLRYNRFHVDAACSPTRAALLSGRNAHQAGFGTITELASGFPGYTGIWKKDAVTVAEVLRSNGYSTAAFGKWHNTPYREINSTGPFDRWPTGLGFDYFYGFMAGATSQWEPSLYRNTTPVEPPATPEQGYHLTNDLTDDAIHWLQTHESLAPQKPYFLYFAAGATHEPHHVPREWIERYRGRFDQGWDKLRDEIFARQKARGVVPAKTVLTPRPKELPAWNSLSVDQKKLLARQMEVFAGFLAHTDRELGRLLRAVQHGPQGHNTLILYIAGDNGGDGKSGLEGRDVPGTVQERLRYIDALGTKQFSNEYAGGWAWATNTPFQWMKQVASHFGGTRAPLVVSWPARIKDQGGLRSQFSHVNAVAATIYEATGIPFPAAVDGVKQQPLDGPSLVYSFDAPSAPSPHRTQIFELVGHRGIYHEGWFAGARYNELPWKRSSGAQDFEQHRWELYHIEQDFSQAHDLAARYPQKLKALQALFDAEAGQHNVYPIGAGRGNVEQPKGQSTLARGRREFVYHAGLPRVQTMPYGTVLPDFSRSHTITAHLVIPGAGAQGVLVSYGSRWGGFALYAKDGYVVYESNLGGQQRDVITSRMPLPQGEVTVTYQFLLDQEGNESNAPPGSLSGTGRLLVNGQPAGEDTVRVRHSLGTYWGSFGVGRAFGSPVSPAFEVPFQFTGTLEKVEVELP